MRPRVEQRLLPIVRGFGEERHAGGDFIAQPPEGAAAIVVGVEADVTALIVDLPVAALRQRGRGRAAHRGEGERAVLELARRGALAEIDAAQPVGDAAAGIEDDAAGRGVGDTYRLADQELRLTVGVGVIGVGDPHDAARVPLAIDAEDAVAVRPFAAEQQMPAIVAAEGEARRGAERVIGAVAALGDAAIRLDLDPLVRLVEHEVDHARNRVGAIGRRRTAGDDLDALHQRLREGVDVDQSGDARSHRAAPVEQHQRTDFTQAA